MEQEYEISSEYLRGYNNCQVIATYEPDLLTDITPAVNEQSEYFTGFFDFKLQYEQEQQKNQEQELSDLRDVGTSIDRDELDR